MPEEVALAIANFAAEQFAADAITVFLYTKTALEVVAVASAIYSVRDQQRKAQNAARAAYEASLHDRYVMYRGATEPRKAVLGRQRVSGPLNYIGSYGANREHLVFGVILAAHEIDAVETIYFNDERVTLDGSGNVVTVDRRDQYSISASTGTFTLSSQAASGSVVAYVDYGTTRLTVTAALAGDGVTVTISGATGGATGTLTLKYQPATSPWVVAPGTDLNATVTLDASGNGYVALPRTPAAGSVRVFSGDPYGGSSDTAPPSQTADPYASVSGAAVTITAAPWPSSTLYIAYRDATVSSRARVLAYTGAAGQVADANMIANLGGAWTSAHKMTGLAWLRVELDFDPDAFPTGLPNVAAVIRGAKLYDPRTSNTAWSENPALMMRYVATSPLLGNLPASAIDDSRIISAANVCDGSAAYVVAGQTFTRALYTAGLVVGSDVRAKDALDDLAKAMAGRWCFVDGTMKVKAGAYVTPLQTLDDTWLVGGQAIQVQAKANRQDVYNIVTGRFSDQTRDYIVTDFPQVSAAAYITEDGANLPTDMQLNAVTFIGQAQQVVAAGLRDARQGLKVTLLCNMRAYQVEPFDVLNVTLARFGWSSKPFEVLDVSWVVEGGIQLTLKETSSTIWDLGSSFSATDPAPNTLFPSPWTVPAISGLACNSGTGNLLRQADGTVMTRIAVTWTALTDALVLMGGGVEVRYGLSTAPESAWQTVEAPFGQAKCYLTENIRDRQVYLVKARAVNGLVKGSWCLPVVHTVIGKTALPSDPAGLAGVAGGGAIAWSWTACADIDYSLTEVRTGGTSWATATLVFRGAASTWSLPISVVGSYTLRIKHEDTTGNQSLNAASATVTAADTALSSISSPNILSIAEKPKTYVDQGALVAENSLLRASALSWGLSTTAYDTAYTALITTYLPTLTSPVPWYDFTNYTTIVGTTYRSTWATLVQARDALRVAIDNAARVSGGGNLLLCGSMSLPAVSGVAGGWATYAHLTPTVIASGAAIGNGKIQRLTTNAAMGSGDSLLATSYSYVNGGIRAPALTNAGTSAVISCYARSPDSSYGGIVLIDSTIMQVNAVQFLNPGMSSGWQRYAWQVDVPTTYAYRNGGLIFAVSTTVASGAIIEISNVQVEYGHTLTNYAETLYGPADTANIAPNAATGRVSVAGASNAFTTTLTTVQSGVITTTGGEVTIWAGGTLSASGSLGGGTGGVILRCELWRDSTFLAVAQLVYLNGTGGFSGNGPLHMPPITDTPTAGAHTYYLKAQWVANGGSPFSVSATTTDAAMVLVEHKV